MIRVLAETAKTYDLPFIGNIRPYAHQAVQLRLAERALEGNRKTIIWNRARTGAGKTLANYGYLTKNPRARALGVYPVNELVKDQFQSLKHGLPLGIWDEISLWTAEEMRKARMSGESKLEQIKRMSTRFHRAVMTNPDHLMLIAQERLYAFKQGERVEAFYRLGEYALQVFDEFHLYNIAQVNFLAQWIALMTASFPNKGFAFMLSSATPRPDVFRLIEGAQIEIWNVQEEVERWLSEENPPVYEERVFLEPLDLHVVSSYLQAWNTGERILKNWSEIEGYLSEWPNAKGLIILDSIHEAQVLANSLREKGYDVGEVHGLSDRSRSREALTKQITVATATVEVGVDFQGEIRKDFLVFEARDPGSFMQRLGRIGRGSRQNPDPPIHVWAYVPGYVAEQIREKTQSEISRSELEEIVTRAYQYFQDFSRYIEKVGGMNLVHSVHLQRKHHMNREQNPVLEEIKSIADRMYGVGFEELERQYRQWKREKLLEPVLSFRGQNTLEYQIFGWEAEESETFYPDIWFWDETAPDTPLKRYEYSFVLRRRRVRFVDREELVRRVKEHVAEPDREELLQALKRDNVLGYAVATGIRENPAKLVWRLPVKASRCTEQLVRLDRLRLESDNAELNDQLNMLFQSMARTSWIVYIVKRSVGELNDQLRLPPLFRLYPAKTLQGADWSIAFNSEAFQLWSAWEKVKSEVL
ncbi:type I-D CRISPR-associated helicase Cas3' [Staphylospora marina]|uniref:type I-D CRISPR-associated helicase Cas3' n=1 Tax=Staphylospora marina TaxID=2490858 RepID=UPI000F5C292D|nr:type I-D CRISPR-associated helicase Cas3' [Staphylospora marina]